MSDPTEPEPKVRCRMCRTKLTVRADDVRRIAQHLTHSEAGSVRRAGLMAQLARAKELLKGQQEWKCERCGE